MKNRGEAVVLGAHLVTYRCAPLRRTLNFIGAHQRNAPKFLQVRTLTFLEALQGLYFGWVAMFISPWEKARSECV
jgi:hypothetical protein